MSAFLVGKLLNTFPEMRRLIGVMVNEKLILPGPPWPPEAVYFGRVIFSGRTIRS